jgi:hypothetical protein
MWIGYNNPRPPPLTTTTTSVSHRCHHCTAHTCRHWPDIHVHTHFMHAQPVSTPEPQSETVGERERYSMCIPWTRTTLHWGQGMRKATMDVSFIAVTCIYTYMYVSVHVEYRWRDRYTCIHPHVQRSEAPIQAETVDQLSKNQPVAWGSSSPVWLWVCLCQYSYLYSILNVHRHHFLYNTEFNIE